MSAGKGQESTWHRPRRRRGRGHCLGCLAWLKPKATCVIGVTDCGAGAQFPACENAGLISSDEYREWRWLLSSLRRK
ncbi:hypothetical protein FF2_018748 [Malus domestica]